MRYSHTSLFLLSVVIAILLQFLGVWHSLASFFISHAPYLGALIAGFFFVISFTSAGAAFLLLELGQHGHPVPLALIAGCGATAADILMYRTFKDSIFEELKLLFASTIAPRNREYLEHLAKKRVFVWAIPLIASLLIASPLPDELGIALFGIINFQPKYIAGISFFLNVIGIFLFIWIGAATT